jgi:hypothetical protein
MCDTTPIAARPRWGALYGATLPPLATLAVVEMASPPNVVRTILRFALALGTLGGMALWVHSNRAAVDLQGWCDCAGRTMTIRVIESHRPAPPLDHEVAYLSERRAPGSARGR